jgi:hypothetical protein
MFRALFEALPSEPGTGGVLWVVLVDLKADLAPTGWHDAGRFLVRGVLGEPAAHQQHDGDQHGGSQPAQSSGCTQAVAEQQSVAMQQPTFGTLRSRRKVIRGSWFWVEVIMKQSTVFVVLL